MDNYTVMHALESAKDELGVIHKSALADELHSLTKDDWKQATQMYSKSAAERNHGFYIDQSKDGEFKIHNDTSKTAPYLNKSVVELTKDDAINDVKIAAATTAGFAATAVASAYSVAALHAAVEMGSAASALVAADVLAFAGSVAVPTLVITGGIAGVVAGGVIVKEAVHNYNLKNLARDDVRNYSEFSFSIR